MIDAWLEVRRHKIAIEGLLLFGRQGGSNPSIGVEQELAPLVLEVSPGSLNFGARILHHLADLDLLGGCELEDPVHSLKRPLTGQAKQVAAIDEGRRHETDRETGDERNRDGKQVELSQQSRLER